MRRALTIVVWIACGCYSPHPAPGSPCVDDRGCPDGLVCSMASRTCERTNVDAPAEPRPMVTTVMVPSDVEADGGGDLVIEVLGEPGESLTIAVSGTLGSYAPASTIVACDAGGYAMATVKFTASAVAGTEEGAVTVSDALGPVEPFTFNFPIVALRRYGQTTPLPSTGAFGADFLLGETIDVPQGGMLRRVAFIAGTAGGMMQIGVYSEVNNAPGMLIAQATATAVLDRNEIALTTPVPLPAGTYWFMVAYRTTGRTLEDASNNRTVKYVDHPFGNALPALFPAAHTTYTSDNFNYYLVVGD